MLNNLRPALRPILEAVGTRFAATGLSANAWTVLGLGFACAAAVAYGSGREHALVAGGLLLLISGLFDVVDGQVARVTRSASARGALLDSVADKIGEAIVFLGILVGGSVAAHWVFVAATLSYLVGYVRARAESLGLDLQGTGIGERAERLLVIALVGMAGRMDWAVAIVSGIAGATFLQRLVVTARFTRTRP